MKQFIILCLLFLSLCSVAQTKISFKGGNQYTVSGEKIGVLLTYELNNPEQISKKTEYFLSEKNGIYELICCTTWQTKGMEDRLDEMRVYQFSVEQLESSPEVSEETDDDDNVISYSLKLVAKEETLFQYDVYDFYSSTPKATEKYQFIKIVDVNKENLKALSERLKLPE